tara:strand:- start:21 stop:365 length:345 start_codon:yes stop_codon:yes gene_type:complete
MYNRFQFKEGQYVRLAEWDTHVNEYGAFSIDNPSSFSKSENVLKKTDSGISGIHVGKIKKIDYDGKLTLDAVGYNDDEDLYKIEDVKVSGDYTPLTQSEIDNNKNTIGKIEEAF